MLTHSEFKMYLNCRLSQPRSSGSFFNKFMTTPSHVWWWWNPSGLSGFGKFGGDEILVVNWKIKLNEFYKKKLILIGWIASKILWDTIRLISKRLKCLDGYLKQNIEFSGNSDWSMDICLSVKLLQWCITWSIHWQPN